MDFLAAIYPGIGFSCTVVLLALSLGQAWIYRKKGYARSRDLALFCFFSSLFAFNIVISHSRLFSKEFTWNYIVVLQPVLFLTFYYYLKSMSYFVAIPRWLKRFYYGGNVFLGVAALIAPITHFITGTDLYFIADHPLLTDNFFVNSYTRFGAPRLFPTLLLSASSLLNFVMTSVLIYRLRKSSGDIFLIIGLWITLIASVGDHMFIAITTRYYVPTLFISNLLEALRMCFLTTEEVSAYVPESKNTDKDKVDEKENTQNTTLSEERLQRLASKLTELLESEKLYENSNLRLEDISFRMGIPSYQLSQVIRFGLNKNFYDLINQYRIEHVQKLLASDEHNHETILDIAIQSGFNSKSTFNAAFKKITGQTPSEFRKSVDNH